MTDDGVTASAAVARGQPVDEIARFCKNARIDTLSIGTHGRSGTQAFWNGSLAQRLLRSCPASVLLAPVVAAGSGGQ